jgi:hypothetical protein
VTTPSGSPSVCWRFPGAVSCSHGRWARVLARQDSRRPHHSGNNAVQL